MSDKERVGFDQLVGRRKLSAVWFDTVEIERESNWDPKKANCMYFTLDGVTYRAQEDPEDGYRSSLKSLTVCKDIVQENVFEEHDVLVVESNTALPCDYFSSYSKDDCLLFIDAGTGSVVLCVGTSNYDDYYPCYEANFYPENLAVNEGKA